MIQITSSGSSKQVLRLSTGEYTFKPGKVLTINKYTDSDVKFLHALGFRIVNMGSQSSMVKEIRKPAPLPKGVVLVEKKPTPKSSSVITSNEVKRARGELTPEVKVVKNKPVKKPVETVIKKEEPVEPKKEDKEEIKEEPSKFGSKKVEEKKEVGIPEENKFQQHVSTSELKKRRPKKKRSSYASKKQSESESD